VAPRGATLSSGRERRRIDLEAPQPPLHLRARLAHCAGGGGDVSAVLAQRLARKLCPNCCELYSPSVEDLIRARVSPDVAASQDGVGFYDVTQRNGRRCSAAAAYLAPAMRRANRDDLRRLKDLLERA
jgi:choline dehydrogenase-like flavoprotein